MTGKHVGVGEALTEDRQLPPMGGIALMAARLAYRRNGEDDSYAEPDLFVERVKLRKNDGYRKSHEFYAILDRIARGEKP